MYCWEVQKVFRAELIVISLIKIFTIILESFLSCPIVYI